MPVSQQKSNEITKTYGNRDKFLMTFNPDVQQDICGDSDICFFGGAPTLAQINATYGFQTAAMWLVPQLYNLSEYCGCKDKLLGRPLEECASVISKEFYYLGHMKATGKTKEFIMPNTTSKAVEIEWALDTPVRTDLYDYIVS